MALAAGRVGSKGAADTTVANWSDWPLAHLGDHRGSAQRRASGAVLRAPRGATAARRPAIVCAGSRRRFAKCVDHSSGRTAPPSERSVPKFRMHAARPSSPSSQSDRTGLQKAARGSGWSLLHKLPQTGQRRSQKETGEQPAALAGGAVRRLLCVATIELRLGSSRSSRWSPHQVIWGADGWAWAGRPVQTPPGGAGG